MLTVGLEGSFGLSIFFISETYQCNPYSLSASEPKCVPTSTENQCYTIGFGADYKVRCIRSFSKGRHPRKDEKRLLLDVFNRSCLLCWCAPFETE